MYYNKNTIRDNSLEDPAELLKEGRWTWDALWEMMTAFCDVEAEKYATDDWWFEGGFSLNISGESSACTSTANLS